MADKDKNRARDEQNRQADNAGLQHKVSNKQSATDVDKGSLSSKTSNAADGGDQQANVSTQGRVDRPSVGEIGTDKQKRKNQILNEQVKGSEDKQKK